MSWFVRTIALLALAGCELIARIPNAVLADASDAPLGSCVSDPAICPAATPACDVETDTCVECVDATDCGAGRPFCELASHTCSAGCVDDLSCDSGACLPDGTCADEARVLYVVDAGLGDCSRASKCALVTAIGQLAAGKDVIQLDAGLYQVSMPLAPMADVIFNGTGVTIQKLGNDGPLFQFNTISVGLHRLALIGAGGQFAVICSASGRLLAKRVAIEGAAAGLSAQCQVTIDRSRFSGHSFFAMTIDTGPLVLTSSFITNNGSDQFASGGVLMNNLVAGSVIEHNTIAGNINNQGGPAGLASCGGTFTAQIRNNIIFNNGIAPACVVTHSVVDASYTGGSNNSNVDPMFVNPIANDYELLPGSPVAGLGDPTTPVTLFDFEGEARPNPPGSNPDPGADEIP